MKPFDATATCPKCGHDRVATSHHAEGWGEYDPRCFCTVKAPHATGKNWLGHVEHLERRCQRCEYTWAEAPIDATREGATDG